MYFKILLSLFYLLAINLHAQQGSIQGKIKDSSGDPAELVNVALLGTSKGSVTNSNGEFFIYGIEPAKYILEISHMGFKTIQINVIVNAGEITVVPEIRMETSTSELGEVVISGKRNKFQIIESEYVSRLPIKNIENPQSYSTSSPELLREQNIISYTSAIQTIPGGVVASQDPAGIVGMYLRGFLTNNYIRNGMYSYNHSSGEMQNVERLEIIKGPSSLIFGTSGVSYGGLINIVTKKPHKHKFLDAGLTFGSYNLQRFTGDINIPFNDDKTILFRLNLAAHSEGSFQDFGFRKSYMAAPSIYYKISDKTELSLDAEITDNTFSSPTWFLGVAGLNVNRIDEIKVDYFKSYISQNLNDDPTRLNSYYAELIHSFSSNLKLKTYISLADLNIIGSNMVPLFLDDSLMVRRLFDYNGQYNSLNVQPFLTGNLTIGNIQNKFVLGFDYKRTYANVSRFYNLNVDTINYTQNSIPALNLAGIRMNYNINLIEKASAENYAVYFSDFLSLTDNLKLMLGLRYEHINYGGRENQLTGAVVTDPYNQGAVSPQGGLSYEIINDQLSLFVNYMRGYNFVPPNNQGQTFKPEFAEQFEGGIKTDLFAGNLSSTISYYYITVDDKIRRDINNPPLSIQDGNQLSKGIDIDLRLSPLTNLDIAAGYGFNESEFTKADADIEGNSPPGTPGHILNFWGSYTFESEFIRGLGFGAGLTFSDEYYYNDANTLIIPSYTLLKGSIFYNRSNMKITLTAENITDEKYWDYIGTPQMPGRFIFSVKLMLD